jgi:succinate dehydrogenase / fumarate reductase membrane anchor subunit
LKFVTPLNRVLGLGSAKDGVGHWWIQRLSAVALVPLGLWFALSLPRLDLMSHAAVVAWMREPLTGILLVLTAAVVIYHSYLGVQVIVEDYIHGKGTKTLVLVASALTHAFLGVACVFAVLRVAFGAG